MEGVAYQGFAKDWKDEGVILPMAENRAITTEKKSQGRPFLPGQSGNPGGRPKNKFGEFIREQTNGGQAIASKILDLFRKSKNPEIVLKAATWLRDTGFGKPAQEFINKENESQIIIVRPINYADAMKEQKDAPGYIEHKPFGH